MAEQTSGAVIRRNVVFNVLGGAWVAAVKLVSVPIQLRALGAETFGLMALVATTQLTFTLLEFGLYTTVIREIASDTSPQRQHTRDLIRTASTIYWLVAALICVVIAMGADWIVANWLTLKILSVEQAAFAIRLLAFNFALGWPVMLYQGVLAGLQRLDRMNVLLVIAYTLSLGVGSVILLAGGDFTAYVTWQIATSILTLILYLAACLRLLPGEYFLPGFSADVFRRIRQFSLDIYAIALIGVVVSNVDRMLIGSVLSLVALGYYDLAVRGGKLMVTTQEFVNGAVMPALAKDYSSGNLEVVSWRFGKYAQMLVYVVSLPAAGMVVWGRIILGLIATPEAADQAAPVLALLAAGSWLGASLSAFYVLTVIANRTRLALWVNLIGLAIYLPTLFVLVNGWGLLGAAAAWLILNIYNLVAFAPLAYGILPGGNWLGWLVRSLIPFVGAALIIFWLGHQAVQAQPVWVVVGGGLLTGLVYLGVGFLLLSPTNREDILAIIRRWLPVRPTSTLG